MRVTAVAPVVVLAALASPGAVAAPATPATTASPPSSSSAPASPAPSSAPASSAPASPAPSSAPASSAPSSAPASSSSASSASDVVAVYWEPPGAPPPGARVKAAFVEALRPLSPRVIDATTPPPPIASLVPLLDAARADWARFAFTEAIARLDALARLADARGGGDLDGRQLSEVFFYRGLCRLELGAADAAWEDLVRAARLDPARVVDPAQFPPRAVNAYHRAVAEVARLPRAELTLDVPAGAVVHVDGALVAGPASATLGPHFVSVAAEGYEPWAAVVSVEGAHTRVAPPLRPYQPPDGDRLLVLAGADPVRELVLGALERTPTGWRFVARDITLADGKVVSDAVALGDAPAAALVRALVRRLVPATAPAAPRSRWWIWAIAGGAAAALAIGLGVGLTTSQTSPAVGGTVGLLQ